MKRPAKKTKAKKTVKKPAPMTARELDDTVGNVVNQLEDGVIADELAAGAVIRKGKR